MVIDTFSKDSEIPHKCIVYDLEHIGDTRLKVTCAICGKFFGYFNLVTNRLELKVYPTLQEAEYDLETQEELK